MPNRSAFTHKPNMLGGIYFHPVHTKDLWNYVWALAKASDWWENDVGCVGNDGEGNFFFQIRGLTTGFAKVTIDDDLNAAYKAKFK